MRAMRAASRSRLDMDAVLEPSEKLPFSEVQLESPLERLHGVLPAISTRSQAKLIDDIGQTAEEDTNATLPHTPEHSG